MGCDVARRGCPGLRPSGTPGGKLACAAPAGREGTVRAASRGSLKGGARREARPAPTVPGERACEQPQRRAEGAVVARVAAGAAWIGVIGLVDFFFLGLPAHRLVLKLSKKLPGGASYIIVRGARRGACSLFHKPFGRTGRAVRFTPYGAIFGPRKGLMYPLGAGV